MTRGHPREHDRRLAWHLTVLCLALVLPILVLAGILAWFYAGGERARIEDEALRTAREVAATGDREFAGLVATTEVLALSRWLQDDDLGNFDQQARDVHRLLGTNVVLRDRAGRQIVNTRLPRGAPLPANAERDSDEIALRTRRPVVSDLFVGAVTGKPLFIVNVPVLRGGEVVYFLDLSLEPERMRDVILQAALPAGWSDAIADRRGFVVAHSSHHASMVGQRLAEAIRGDGRQREGLIRGDDPAERGVAALVAFSRSQFSGWIGVVTVPADQISAPLRRSLVGLSGLAVAILALSVWLAFVFARRIEKPVGALAADAARLGHGEPVQPLATPVREVNALSRALSEASRERQAAEAALRRSESATREAAERVRELQSELLHASRLSAMGQMAASFAHELNQPLGAATNFLGAARLALEADGPAAPERALGRIEKAAEQTVRAGAILRRLRDFVRRRETERQIVDARQLVEDAAALALVGVHDPGLATRFDFDPDVRAVVVDRIQIQQVVFNLVRNALEATEGRTPREIVLSARSVSETTVEIAVADNGSGLPADPKALFEPFVTSKSDGMGMGLSICRAIVEAHHGRLWAEPRAGGGAIFRFEVPAARKAETADG